MLNNLRTVTESRLTKKQFQEMYREILQDDIISDATRRRDFSGKENIPKWRKDKYLQILKKYLPDITFSDLFPPKPRSYALD